MIHPLREADECCYDGQVEKRHNPDKEISVVDEVTMLNCTMARKTSRNPRHSMIFHFPQLRSPVYNQISAPPPKITQMSAKNTKFVTKNLFDVEGWTCVVTDGGTGIGLMIAQTFANNGAKVYITSRRQDVLEHIAKQWGPSLAHPKGKIIPVTCDVTSKDSDQAIAPGDQQPTREHRQHQRG